MSEYAATRIDVCIPVHSPAPAHFVQLLSSLAAQTLSEFTVCISDDTGDPAVESIVSAFSDRLRIAVRSDPSSEGMVANWNRAVRMGHAPLVITIGQDDALERVALERLSTAMSTYPYASMCSSGRTLVNDSGHTIDGRRRINDRSRVFVQRAEYVLEANEFARLCLRNGNVYGEPSCVLFRRDYYDAVGGYDSTFRHAVDMDFNLKMSSHGNAIYLRDALLIRRQHNGAQTVLNVANGISSLERLRLLESYKAAVADPVEWQHCCASTLSHAVFDLARAVTRGRWSVARLNLRIVWQLRTTRPKYVWARLLELWSGRNKDQR